MPLLNCLPLIDDCVFRPTSNCNVFFRGLVHVSVFCCLHHFSMVFPLIEVSFTFLKILVFRTMLSIMLCQFCCVYTVEVATLKNLIRSACKEDTHDLSFVQFCLLEPFMVLIGASSRACQLVMPVLSRAGLKSEPLSYSIDFYVLTPTQH